MLTRNGVCYDLSVSPYRCTVGGITFSFSSRLHREKFLSTYLDHRKQINVSLTKRFGLVVDLPHLADVVLYKRIENRGFFVELSEGEATCLNNLKCDGCSVTKHAQRE